jgi:CheY-like chemotaxis protein
MTAYVDEETRQRVRATSPWRYLHKPFTAQQIQSALQEVLASRPLDRP